MNEMKHILAVDDVPSNLKFAEQLLGGRYKLTLAISGAQALKFLNKVYPDLILLDLNMPEMDGCETIARIKEQPRLAGIPVIFLTSEHDAAMEVKCLNLGAVDFIRKPFVTEIMISRIETQLELSSYRTSLEVKVAEKTFLIERLQDVMATCFAEMVESRDGTTGGHIKNTTRYFRIFIDELSARPEYAKVMTEGFKRNLIRACPLHDIGKIGINDAILRKEAALDKEEFELMKTHSKIGGDTFEKIFESIEGIHNLQSEPGIQHPQMGASAFQKIFDTLKIEEGEDTQFLHVAKDMALCHHERWNGTGYPEGLSGDAIPICARILSIVDVYDALTSARPYKVPFSHEKALEIILNDRGIFFDPALTDIFVEISDRIKACLEEKITFESLFV
jgi:putative two-component system response regulator